MSQRVGSYPNVWTSFREASSAAARLSLYVKPSRFARRSAFSISSASQVRRPAARRRSRPPRGSWRSRRGQDHPGSSAHATSNTGRRARQAPLGRDRFHLGLERWSWDPRSSPCWSASASAGSVPVSAPRATGSRRAGGQGARLGRPGPCRARFGSGIRLPRGSSRAAATREPRPWAALAQQGHARRQGVSSALSFRSSSTPCCSASACAGVQLFT